MYRAPHVILAVGLILGIVHKDSDTSVPSLVGTGLSAPKHGVQSNTLWISYGEIAWSHTPGYRGCCLLCLTSTQASDGSLTCQIWLFLTMECTSIFYKGCSGVPLMCQIIPALSTCDSRGCHIPNGKNIRVHFWLLLRWIQRGNWFR